MIMMSTADPSAQQMQSRLIRGVVASAKGPEAGVWVIAETKDLPTKLTKIVVTNDAGRFVLRDLPNANFSVWVRGYGLVDSAPVTARPGGNALALKAVVAQTPQEAGKVYPANYWYSLLEIPAKSEFPGTGPNGNGISTGMKSQAQWIDQVKQGCEGCHQMGNAYTRSVSHLKTLGLESVEAWDYRVQVGQRSAEMTT